MSTINTSYAAMQYTMNATQQSNKQTKQQGSSKVAQSSQTEAAGQKTLSKDAQAVLEKLANMATWISSLRILTVKMRQKKSCPAEPKSTRL